jgi:hypothetical protein
MGPLSDPLAIPQENIPSKKNKVAGWSIQYQRDGKSRHDRSECQQREWSGQAATCPPKQRKADDNSPREERRAKRCLDQAHLQVKKGDTPQHGERQAGAIDHAANQADQNQPDREQNLASSSPDGRGVASPPGSSAPGDSHKEHNHHEEQQAKPNARQHSCSPAGSLNDPAEHFLSQRWAEHAERFDQCEDREHCSRKPACRQSRRADERRSGNQVPSRSVQGFDSL